MTELQQPIRNKKVIQIKCAICGALSNQYNIGAHVKKYHNIDSAEYKDKYLPKPKRSKTLLFNSNLSRTKIKKRLNCFIDICKKRCNITPTLTHIKAAFYLMCKKDFNNGWLSCVISNPDANTTSVRSIIDHYYRLISFPRKSENIEYLTLRSGKEFAENYMKSKGDRVRGSNNPGYQHGGKLSPFSKKFVKGDISEQTHKKAQQSRDSHPERQTTKLEHYLFITNGNEKEAKQLFKERQAVGRLSKFIERYGDEEGKRRWEERQQKWQTTLNTKSLEERREINRKKIWKNGISSNLEKEIYKKIKSIIPDVKKQLRVIRSKEPDKWYIYDIYYKNKIIEVNGDYWHGNPNRYSANENVFFNVTASDIWKKDKDKIDEAISKGYSVKVLWESDYYKDKDKSINDCVNFLLG